jgi:glucose/arabinose dehydrogenase
MHPPGEYRETAHGGLAKNRLSRIFTLPMTSPAPLPSKPLLPVIAALFLPLSAFAAAPAVVTDPPTTPLSPEEALKHFHIEDGYRLEVVLSEPEIAEPVVAAFDGNGRMFVAEMRTYMQDIDGKNQMDPVSRVSMHTDTDGDGTYDKHTVFIDKLLLPRMILPLDDRLIVCETNTLDFYSYRDTDGDGVADQKELFFKGGPRGGNLEHQPSGLIWGMDNWMYITTDPFRLRITPEGVVKGSTSNNGGQWGLTQDDYGKPWFTNAGGERGPLNFQTHIAYGGFTLPGEFAPGFKEVWPVVGLADVEGGPNRFRAEDKTLNHFTATCGQEIYRGDKLPDLRGDLLFAEPVGRLIRRARVQLQEGVVTLSNPYEKSEFIRSTDPNFRPVNMVTAPDGSLYIVDMYRGIIQEGSWVRPGATCAIRWSSMGWIRTSGAAVFTGSSAKRLRPLNSRGCSRKPRTSSSPTSRTRTAGGAILRRSCSSCAAINPSCLS